jgi:SAM-dependent methyltransferase
MSKTGGGVGLSFQWTPGYWQGWRESKNPYRQFKSERDRTLTVEALELQDGERVLEVGCGYGWITEALHRAARIHWIGLDHSPPMVQRLRTTFPDLGSHTFIGDARCLPLASASFDKVLCTGVLMHINGESDALREFARVLRPGGRLVCSINNALSPFSIPVRLRNSFKNGFVQNFCRPDAFQRFLRSLGFDICGTRGDALAITVPLQVGPVSIPPRFAFPFLRGVDQWAVERVPWLAYEVWFAAVKSKKPSNVS